jgi:hypothetical protein
LRIEERVGSHVRRRVQCPVTPAAIASDLIRDFSACPGTERQARDSKPRQKWNEPPSPHKVVLRLAKAKSTLKALDVELTEAEEAKSAPVMLPAGSLAHAREALLESVSEVCVPSVQLKSA